MRMCPCEGAWHHSADRCVEYLATQVQRLKLELRGQERQPDAFSVSFMVTLDVPDPHDTADLGLPRSQEALYRWLRGLVCNAPPKGVKAEVSYVD